ncbi:MAG: hypothetical protein K2Z81_00970, partial [Cyanobacteria bacterium]|nr:hypothetical protein [Cyanobacteriota bacterium]
DAIVNEKARLRETRIKPAEMPVWDEALSEYEERLTLSVTLEELLRRPRVPYELIEKICPASTEPFPFHMEVETDIKYTGYIERQRNQVLQSEKYDNVKLPADVDYAQLIHLSKEAREKLNRIRPETVGQASRIGGVRPADVSVLMVWLESMRRQREWESKKRESGSDLVPARS